MSGISNQHSKAVNNGAKTVLLAPLDWGLGHATRCIPLVEYLLECGCHVVLCVDGAPAALLRLHFGQRVGYQVLPGYGIRYGRGSVLRALMPQVPRFLQAIRMERAWLHRTVATLRPDAIISDNRYGFHHDGIPSVLLTHQLQPALPPSFGKMTGMVRRLVYRMMESFDACWVPDAMEEQESLSGLLGHPAEAPPIPVHYIGALSHLGAFAPSTKPNVDLLIILSGPEPQRTILEQLVVQQIAGLSGRFVLLRGLPADAPPLQAPDHLEVINYAGGRQLEDLISNSRYVLCRGGYSSLMDLIPRGVRCLLVPTPGQTEQEYLAQRLQEKNMAITMPQHQLQLPKLLELAEHFPWKPASQSIPNSCIPAVVNPWLQSIR